jgi:predicted transcriptional regulator
MSDASRVVKLIEIVAPQESRASLFHTVNRILPEDQILKAIPPDTPARDALVIMEDNGYSQLPVKQGSSVLGIFSYRTFALEVLKSSTTNAELSYLPVEEFLEYEDPAYARLTDNFDGLIDTLDKRDCVVVSGPEDMIAILTPMDVLRYLHSVANAFVLIEEIELSLRHLILVSTGDNKNLNLCIQSALAKKYKSSNFPERLEDMTFDECIALVRDGRNWQFFEKAFGGTRERVRGRLEPVRDLRNDAFHFRRELSIEDHEILTACRAWLFRRVKNMQALQEGSV